MLSFQTVLVELKAKNKPGKQANLIGRQFTLTSTIQEILRKEKDAIMVNESSGNITAHYCVSDCAKEATNNLKTIYLSSSICLNIAGIAINAMIMFVYQKFKQLRTKSNVIIVAMCITGILLAVSEMACSIVHMIAPAHNPNKHWVTAQKGIEAVLSCYCIQATAILSIQRQFIVNNIQRPHVHTKLLRMTLTLIAMAIVTATASIPLIIMSNTVWLNATFYTSKQTIETESRQYYYYRIIFTALFSLCPSCITIGSYCYIEHRVRRKSKNLHKRIRRDLLNRRMQKKADMQTSLGVVAILTFIIVFHIPNEAMTFLLVAQERLIPQKWMYFVTILMSNIFQQCASLIHVCTSTRYRVKLRQSLARTNLSTHTNESGTMSKKHPLNILQKTKLTALNNQQTGSCHSTSVANRKSKEFRGIQILQSVHGSTITDNITKEHFMVKGLVEKEIVISICGQISGKSIDNTKSEQVATQSNRHKCNTIVRRYTDSELIVKSSKYILSNNDNKLFNAHTYCDKIVP